MSDQIAVQMYTLRAHTATAAEFEAALKRVRAIGYTAVQLSAVGAMNGPHPEVDAADARRMLDDNGLRCIATHRNWADLRDHTDVEIAFHRRLGCDFVAIGSLPQSYVAQGPAGAQAFLADAAPVIQKLKQGGVRFGYHNHAFEFLRFGPNRSTVLDLFIEAPEMLLELDVYWAVHAGANPARILERRQGRTPVVHLKDKEISAEGLPIMAPVGEGNLDWPEILSACRTAGVEWYAVEQDECYRDPFDCLRASYEYLRGQGL